MRTTIFIGMIITCSLMAVSCSDPDPEADRRTAEANAKFKQWALENTAVTDISINSSSLFVTLTPEKYTTEANVQHIANALARAYCLQTNKRFAVCRVYLGERVYAKGDFFRK